MKFEINKNTILETEWNGTVLEKTKDVPNINRTAKATDLTRTFINRNSPHIGERADAKAQIIAHKLKQYRYSKNIEQSDNRLMSTYL